MITCWAEKYCKGFNKPSCTKFCEGYVVLEILYKFSNIPQRYQYPVILETKGPDEKIYQELSNIMSNDIVKWINSGNSLLLWGDRKGNGKTTMACAIANKYIREMASKTTFDPVVHFIKTAKFLEEMRQQFTNPTPEWPERMRMIETVPLLIIDDIGAEKPSDWVRERLLNIIDERYSNNLSIIYTSNCTKAQMLENLHERVYDRMKDAKSLEFTGNSWRGLNNG